MYLKMQFRKILLIFSLIRTDYIRWEEIQCQGAVEIRFSKDKKFSWKYFSWFWKLCSIHRTSESESVWDASVYNRTEEPNVFSTN